MTENQIIDSQAPQNYTYTFFQGCNKFWKIFKNNSIVVLTVFLLALQNISLTLLVACLRYFNANKVEKNPQWWMFSHTNTSDVCCLGETVTPLCPWWDGMCNTLLAHTSFLKSDFQFDYEAKLWTPSIFP